MSVLLLDETCSDLPVRDTDCKPAVFKAIQEVVAAPYSRKQQGQRIMKVKDKDLKMRRRVSLVSREELEDTFLRIHEENLLLKDHARKMENKIKRMGTRLLRVTSDLVQTGKSAGARRDGRDLEAEETIEDLQDRVRDLEHKNETLRHKLVTYKQRLQVQSGCRHCPYSTVAARTDSGVRKNVLPDKFKRGLRVQSLEVRPPQVCQVQACGETLSDEAREEIERLFNLIESQNNRADDKPAGTLNNMESMRSVDAVAEMMLSLQRTQQAENQRAAIQENVMVIRLQKELREKNTSLCALREQFRQLKESYETELQQNQKSLTLSHEAVLTQLEDLTSQLKAERAKVVAMEIEQQSVLNLQRSLQEFQERVTDVEKENGLLKENYENILKSSLNEEKVGLRQAAENELREKISLLEEQIQRHVSDNILNNEQLQHEREQNEHLKKEVSQLNIQLLEKIQEVKSYQERVSALLSSSVNGTVQEQPAVTLQRTSTPRLEGYHQMREFNAVMDRWFDGRERQKMEEMKHQMRCEDEQRQREDSEKQREEEEQKKAEAAERQKWISKMDADHAETILELEKTREMLFLQHKINNDNQEELKAVRLKAESESRDKEERKSHYEASISKYRARIHTLQAQLKDIAYGTIPSRYEAQSPDVDMSPVPSLRRGETLFEVHIGAICFTPWGLREVSDPQPHTFCVYSLYDYETHATPVVTGTSPGYNFTSHYAVTPDAEFLRYLRVGILIVELYQALGGEHRMLARGHIKLEATLQSTEKIHGAVTLTDVTGENIGELDYWICLHGSISQVRCAQKQSKKARSYLSAGSHCRSEKSLASPFSTGIQNELSIRIWGCRSLKVGYLGYQPSPYAMYRFYHHPDHSTAIIPCSNNPQFGDEFVYPLQISSDLERYLQKECLYVYVFDDEDMQPGVYLGRAEVPLVSLAKGDNIQGDFALLDPCGKCSGSIQLSMEWKFPNKATSYQSTKEVALSQHCTEMKLLPSVAPKLNLTQLKQSKTRKAEEDQQDDMTSIKRGRKDFPSTSSQNTKQTFQKSDLLPAEHHNNDLDTQQEEAVQVQEGDKMHDRRDEDEISGDHTADANDPQSTEDEDIILVVKPHFPEKTPSSMIRVEIMSLTLYPYSEVMGDSAVQRLFVEFRFAGVPPEETETPVSLRKPNQGEELYYHFSKVIHLDGSEHAKRRDFLYMLLEGSDSNGDIVRLRFTVVSDPINEDEEECHDVGYAYMDLRPLLRRAEDKAEETLQVLDVANQEQVIGALRVAIEAKEAARTLHRTRRTMQTW